MVVVAGKRRHGQVRHIINLSASGIVSPSDSTQNYFQLLDLYCWWKMNAT